MSNTLYYAHDPMCSWCWGFRPVWELLQTRLPAEVRVRPILGGLAADSDQPMAPDMQSRLQDTWRRIEQRIPGARFNFAFWETCSPRRSTYPACRAVIAARMQRPGQESNMVLAIQRAYYEQARNPSDHTTLVELAGELGLDPRRFSSDLAAPATQAALERDIAHSRTLGLTGFPSLLLDVNGSRWPVPVNYTDHHPMLEHIRILLEMD